MGPRMPSFRRFPSTPRAIHSQGSALTCRTPVTPGRVRPVGRPVTGRVTGGVTAKVLERKEAKNKIAELEDTLREICQSGFDEAYMYNSEESAGKLAGEFVGNLKHALTKLIDRFKSRYLKARRATHDMFQHSSDMSTRLERSSPTKRNTHTSTDTLPLHGAESEDSITTATSNFFRPNTSRSAVKSFRLCSSPARHIEDFKSKENPPLSARMTPSEFEKGFTEEETKTPLTINVPQLRPSTPSVPHSANPPSTPSIGREVSIQTSVEPSPTKRSMRSDSMECLRNPQPNFFMNTIAYDMHLYMRMLYLQKRGNLEGAQILRELLTHPLKEI